ncbi:hypothetical protein JQ625_10960 [Bradyrhizobium diazoefficiens]|nr:hypothetical protein [Bradyrhizobium diazoefficiens]MBR0775351.1 hypothetical protein [Bradyrhizobium diazoefficiens]
MDAAIAIFAVVCTAHYFWALLQRPALLAAMFTATDLWKITLLALYRFGVAMGIAGMIFLAVKEVWYIVAGYRLGIAYDSFVGLGAVGLTILLLRGFERTAKLVTAPL